MLLTEITTTVPQIISSLGFPVAACIAMAWYVKYITDKHDKEMDKVTTALNNNTLALQKLCNKLGEEMSA